MMRTRNVIARTVCLVPALLAVLTTVARAADKPAAATQPKPPTVAATRTIELIGAPDDGEFNDMLRDAAAEHAKTLGVKPDHARTLVAVKALTHGPNPGEFAEVMGASRRFMLFARLDADVPNPRADEFLDGVVNSLGRQLDQWHRFWHGIDKAQGKLDEARREWEDNRHKLRAYQDRVRATTDRVDATIDQLRAAVPKLEEERQALKLQVVGKQARQDALASTIARLSKAAEERVTADSVAEELEKIVKAREVAKERIKKLHERGAASDSELAEADGPIAEARARLLERREAVAQANGGELLAALNRELANVAVDVAEARAKLVALEDQLQRFDAVRDDLDRADDLRQDQTRLRRLLDEADGAFRAAAKALPDPPLRVIKSQSMAPGDRGIQNEVDPAFEIDPAAFPGQ